MDSVVDFITENYVWIIVGAIILIMFIIGYIADKTDFGRKPSQKKEKVKQEVKPEPLQVEDKGINEIAQDINNAEPELPIETTEDENSLVQEEVNEEFDQSLFEPLESQTVEVNEEPVIINNEDDNSNVETVEQPVEEDNIWNF